MMELYYLSGTGGEKLDLMSSQYRANIQDLLQYEWDYETSDNVGRNGGRITEMKRSVATKSMTISVMGSSREAYMEALNRYLRITERDIRNLTPGRLYLGENYLTCYLAASQYDTDFDPGVTFARKAVTLVSEYPFWRIEETTRYLPDDRETESAEYLDYPYDYNYDYLYDLSGARQLINDHYASSDFVMTVYGPAVNPTVYIAGHKYMVATVLYDGDYMVIDSAAKTVIRIAADGTSENLFNCREKDSEIFEKIPPGNNTVIFNQEFGFDLTLYRERSEPEWSI
jgi:hypothetical protein